MVEVLKDYAEQVSEWSDDKLVGLMLQTLNRFGEIAQEVDERLWEMELALKQLGERTARSLGAGK